MVAARAGWAQDEAVAAPAGPCVPCRAHKPSGHDMVFHADQALLLCILEAHCGPEAQ